MSKPTFVTLWAFKYTTFVNLHAQDNRVTLCNIFIYFKSPTATTPTFPMDLGTFYDPM